MADHNMTEMLASLSKVEIDLLLDDGVFAVADAAASNSIAYRRLAAKGLTHTQLSPAGYEASSALRARLRLPQQDKPNG